ncbi:MAG TPA: hypothetical protein VLZ75_08620 [Chitinophagales bacterium]|nr:hypothetical protein [Chitinophagales bacterium]
MKFDPTSKKLLAIGIIFYLIVTLCSSNIPFFWDSILTASVAQWFYNNGIQQGIAPIIWDAGHPTLFQIYLSFTWKIFGKSLMVSHFSMLPFLGLMMVCFVYLMQKVTLSIPARIFGLLFFLLHPYILTQSTLVSYDIVQIGFLLLAIIGILEHKKLLLVFGLWGLSTCSIRGQMIAMICLFVYVILNIKNWKAYLPIIILSIAPIITWHAYHYSVTGWMISTPSSTWESQRNIANIQQISSNIIGIIRGFVDYGVIALSIMFFFILLAFRKSQWNQIERNLLVILFFVFVGLCGSMIFFSNPIGHRYFMILHVVMILLVISRLERIKNYRIFSSLVLLAFITGHFWLYPNVRSNGWDVTLQYISYEKNRIQFWEYLKENNISTNEIQSAFPLFCSLEQTNLETGERLLDISESLTIPANYIAFSTVCNDMKEFLFIEKDSSFHLVRKFGKGKTAISLYGF